MSLLDRSVIFVNENDYLRLMMFFQHASQIQEWSGIFHITQLIRLHSGQIILFHRIKAVACKKLIVPHKFISDHIFNCHISTGPIRKLCIFESDGNHRKCTLHLLIFFTTWPNLFIFKINRCILFRFFKKRFKHIKSKCFAESSWSGKQNDRNLIVNQITDQKSFIYIITVLYYIHVRCIADCARKDLSISRFRFFSANVSICSLLRNLPIATFSQSTFQFSCIA